MLHETKFNINEKVYFIRNNTIKHGIVIQIETQITTGMGLMKNFPSVHEDKNGMLSCDKYLILAGDLQFKVYEHELFHSVEELTKHYEQARNTSSL